MYLKRNINQAVISYFTLWPNTQWLLLLAENLKNHIRFTDPGIDLKCCCFHSWTEMLFSGTSQFKWMTQVEIRISQGNRENLISYLRFASFQRIKDSRIQVLKHWSWISSLGYPTAGGTFWVGPFSPQSVIWLYFKLCIAQDSIGPSSRSLEHILMKTYFVSVCAELG